MAQFAEPNSVRTNLYDVAIIGAGPAGTTAALAMGKSKLRVVIIDKSIFPREKICGDAVAAYVPKVLRRIDPLYAESFLANAEKQVVNCCHISAPDSSSLDLKYPESGFIVERFTLDHMLMQWVKVLPEVTVLEGEKVNDIIRENDGFSIILESGAVIKASMLIGADGAQGICAKQLTTQAVDHEHYSAAVRTYYSGVTGVRKDTFELHFLPGLSPGYFWIFPMSDGRVNVGLGVPSDEIQSRKINLRHEFERIISSHSGLKERFCDATAEAGLKGFGLPLGSRKVQLSGERFMLCGDAGSLIDPLTGEGIGQAILTGRYAGWQVMNCFQRGDFSAVMMKNYDKAVYKKVWRDNQRRFWVRRWMNKHPVLFSKVVRMADRHEWIYKLIARIV